MPKATTVVTEFGKSSISCLAILNNYKLHQNVTGTDAPIP